MRIHEAPFRRITHAAFIHALFSGRRRSTILEAFGSSRIECTCSSRLRDARRCPFPWFTPKPRAPFDKVYLGLLSSRTFRLCSSLFSKLPPSRAFQHVLSVPSSYLSSQPLSSYYNLPLSPLDHGGMESSRERRIVITHHSFLRILGLPGGTLVLWALNRR